MCTTTSHYETHISTECATGGSGQCDGFCATHPHTECTCSCHNDWDLPQTVAEVRDWHDEANGVLASFESGSDDEQYTAATLAQQAGSWTCARTP